MDPRSLQAVILFGVMSLIHGQTYYSCNNVVTTYQNPACTYPSTTGVCWLCNGQCYSFAYTGCFYANSYYGSYNTAVLNNGVVTTGSTGTTVLNAGTTTTTGVQWLCNGVLYQYQYPGCTYGTVATNNIFPNNNGQFSTSFTFANPGGTVFGGQGTGTTVPANSGFGQIAPIGATSAQFNGQIGPLING